MRNLDNLKGLQNHGDEDKEQHCSIKLTPPVLQVGFAIVDQSHVVDFGDHFSNKCNQANDVGNVGHIEKEGIVFKSLGSVEHDRKQADQSQESQETPGKLPAKILK